MKIPRLYAALLAVLLVGLIAGATQASAADRGWTPTGDLQGVYLQVHNGLIAPDDSSAEQFQVSIINYNSVAVNGKLAFYAVGKDGKPKGKAVAEGGFQLPADGPTTAILLPTEKLTKLITSKKFKGLKVRAKVALWTNGFTKLGKAEGNYRIVKKLKGEKGGANSLPTQASFGYTVKEGATLSGPVYSLLSSATDADFDHLYLRVTQRPKNAKTFNIGADGLFTYVGNANFAGTDSFVYDIFDGIGYSAPVTVTITVTAKPPTIATIADQKVNGGTQASAQTFSLKSFAQGSGTLTYDLAGSFPTGTTINAANGTVTVPSGTVTAGSYTASFKATNSAGTTTKSFKIIVKPGKVGTISDQLSPIDTPITPLATAGAFSAAAGATYSATGLPTGLSIDSSTGIISGTPTVAGITSVVVTVTDANGTATQPFSWEIQVP